MDLRGLLPLVIGLNIAAVAVFYSRFAETDLAAQVKTQIETVLESFINPNSINSKSVSCGLIPVPEYILLSSRVVLPNGIQPAAIHISGGKIIKVSSSTAMHGPEVIDFKDSVIMPGVIDVHAHLNEPGREDWEGLTTGTAAAAAGGVTTLVDMPLNSFPVTTVRSRLEEKQMLAEKKSLVNVAHWAGLTPDNAADHQVLADLVAAGALGFKSFMSPSGIDDFPNVGAADIAAALPFLKSAGVPYFVHAEFVTEVPLSEGLPTSYETYLSSRPPKFEQDAIELLIKLLDEDNTTAAPGFVLHIAHLSDSGCLPLIKAAVDRGLPVSVETCAHYLSFSSHHIADGQTLFKCAPPIRDEPNRKALLSAVLDGRISVVTSDHSPAPPSLKQLDTGDFIKAWGGISGLQYLLPATWTALKAEGG
ncbi:hypothetical protein CEUSTIGMA_g12857.t1, partial [Chlamydomonas eustigma]